jgi:hypothetical protein
VRHIIVDDNGPFLEVARPLLERQGMMVVGVATTGDLTPADNRRPIFMTTN